MIGSDVKLLLLEWLEAAGDQLPERISIEGGQTWILKQSSPEGRLLEDIRIDASDDDWVRYYQSVVKSDPDAPISLMWVHLSETVAEAERFGGKVAIIDPFLRMAEQS